MKDLASCDWSLRLSFSGISFGFLVRCRICSCFLDYLSYKYQLSYALCKILAARGFFCASRTFCCFAFDVSFYVHHWFPVPGQVVVFMNHEGIYNISIFLLDLTTGVLVSGLDICFTGILWYYPVVDFYRLNFHLDVPVVDSVNPEYVRSRRLHFQGKSNINNTFIFCIYNRDMSLCIALFRYRWWIGTLWDAVSFKSIHLLSIVYVGALFVLMFLFCFGADRKKKKKK